MFNQYRRFYSDAVEGTYSLVDDLEGLVVIPILWLHGGGVGDLGLIDPSLGLAVVGVVDLLCGVDRGVEVLEERTLGDDLVVDEDLE